MFPRKAWGLRESLVTVVGGGGVPNLQCRAREERRPGEQFPWRCNTPWGRKAGDTWGSGLPNREGRGNGSGWVAGCLRNPRRPGSTAPGAAGSTSCVLGSQASQQKGLGTQGRGSSSGCTTCWLCPPGKVQASHL